MNKKKKNIIMITTAVIFIAISVLFMFGRNFMNYGLKIRTTDSTVMPEATGTTDPINEGSVIEQKYLNTTETISDIGIVFYRLTLFEDDLIIDLLEGEKLLARKVVKSSKIESEHRTFINPGETLDHMKDKELIIRIYVKNKENTGLAIMINDKENSTFKYNGIIKKGTLCFSVNE